MTKSDLIEAVMKSVKDDDLSKRLATDIINNAFGVISKSIKKDKRFSFPDFGTFTVRNRKARKGRNPQTGEVIQIPAKKVVKFRIAKACRDSIL